MLGFFTMEKDDEISIPINKEIIMFMYNDLIKNCDKVEIGLICKGYYERKK